MGTPRDSSSNHHSPRGGSGSSGEAVNSPQSRRWNNLSSPWARVVQGQAESTSPVQHSPSPPRSPSISSAAPEQSSFSEKVMSSSSSPPPPVDNADGAGVNNNASLAKKPAWNMPSNGVLENEPVMGAESWPALSESARASPKSSSVEALWKSAADGSVTSSEGPVIPHSPQKQTASSAKSNSAPNHTMAARQRSMKHGSGVGGSSMSGGGPPQSTFAHPPVPPPPPPHPFPLPSHTMPTAPDQSPMEQYYRGNSWEMRPIGGFVPQPRVVNDHRNYSRRGNFGPRGDGPLHNNYGGRRQDRGNYMNAGDVHVQSQRGQARPLVRPPTSPPPFLPPQNIRPFPNHVGDVVYFPTMPVEPFRGMGPYVPHGSYHAMYMPVPDPPLPFKLVTQIDYYFSDVNLEGDDFLKSNMDDQGWVPISLIASFPRVKNLTNNLQFILDSLRGSAIVEVQDDKLRRRNNWMKYVTNSSRFVTGSTSPPATGPNQDMVATSLEKLNLSQEASDRNEPGKSTPHSEDAAGRHLPGLTGRPSSPMGRLLKT